METGDDDDVFVSTGTPLEPFEDDAVVRKKPVPIQDQIVTDEQGRRRFHGAFTGGFSAGYYNTVGSKEGWTPSTFKSTRKDRTAVSTQSVQDFMDEEDMGAFGIAPQILRPTEDFSSRRRENLKRTRPTPAEGPIPGEPVLVKIIQPVVETMGIKVLRKMGWRPGQGVGPKFRKRSKDKKKTKVMMMEANELEEGGHERIYGCALPPSRTSWGEGSSDNQSDDENVIPSLVAPDDVDSLLCNPKENSFGLGYKGLDRDALLSGRVDLFGPSLKFKVENRKMDIAGEAFGIGAFEDEDEEVYSRDDMSQYDFALETPHERKRRLHEEAREKRKRSATSSAIPGFSPAKNPPILPKYFPPPQLPPNFEPIHVTKKSRFSRPNPDQTKKEESSKLGLDRHQLSRDERKVLLEDSMRPEPVVGKPFSEAKSPDSSEKVTLLAVQTQAACEQDSKETDTVNRMERLKKFAEVLQTYSSQKPKSVLGSFQPFAKHPGKQERYEKYLTLKAAGFGECLKDLQPSEMTEWEREHEKMEFERAGALYKPLSGEMSSRFVSAKSHDISHLVPEREKEKEKDPTQDPKVAAKMNLFGQLTHKVEEWHPDRLVCKRFNVPPPYPDSKMVGVRKAVPQSKGAETVAKEAQPQEPPPKKSLFADLDFSKPPPGLLPQPSAEIPGGLTSSNTHSSQLEFLKVQLGPAAQDDVPIQPSRAPLDLFKEIFADTSESEEETADVENQSSLSSNPEVKKSTVPVPSGTIASKAVFKEAHTIKDTAVHGVFHNLDLSKLGTHEPERSPTNGTEVHATRRVFTTSDENDDEPVYGPAPPSDPRLPAGKSASQMGVSNAIPSVSTSKFSTAVVQEVWVEKAPVLRKKRKHKEEKAHHKKKRKSKKKVKQKKSLRKDTKSRTKIHSRHKRDVSSSSDDSDSSASDSGLPSVTIHQSDQSKAIIAKLNELI